MLQVIFYTKEICSLCEDAYALLKMLQFEYSFKIEEVDIYSDDRLLEKYQLLIPAVKINDTFINCEEMSLERLEAAIKNEINK